MNKQTKYSGAWFLSKPLGRVLSGLMMLFLLVNILSIGAFAVWDGQGATGNENSESIVGDYSMPYANASDILGYRFTVYDGNGNKLGYTVDIDRKTHSYSTLYRSCYGSKRSHIDLYRAYQTYSSSSNIVALGYVSSTNSDDWVYYDSSLPSTPTSVESWLTQSRAVEIAVNYCGATAYDYATCYIIVEPIIIAKLDGSQYAMTMAEYAVYQSSLYGWTSYGDKDAGVAGTYRYVLMRPLSGYFGRYLYAVRDWPVLGTEPVPVSALKNDARGTASILLGSSDRYNTAANVLKYQVGMAVYTGVKASNTYTLTVKPNGGTWNGYTTTKTYELVNGQTMSIPVPTRSGYTFSGWTVSGGGTLSSKTSAATYTQGSSNCTITATWTSAPTSYTNTIAFYAGEFKNQEGNSESKNWLSLGSTTFTADAGSSVTMNSARAISAPHGHYLASTFGTSGLAGSWTRYTMPYTFTQPSQNLWLEYDFIANEYKITYNLNGGTNNSANPSTYNVHYGVSLKNPTRTD